MQVVTGGLSEKGKKALNGVHISQTGPPIRTEAATPQLLPALPADSPPLKRTVSPEITPSSQGSSHPMADGRV